MRTDYPGAKTPSEQILGPNYAPQTLAWRSQTFTGRFDDRYNFAGFALEEMRRFEEMAQRGNLVRIGFQDQTFEALITSWRFDYRRDWYIPYEFTVSVHGRAGDFQLTRSPDTTRSATQAFDECNDIIAALVLADEQKRQFSAVEGKMNTPAVDGVKGATAAMLERLDSLADTLDQQALNVAEQSGRAVSPFRRLATHFRGIANSAFSMVDTLVEVRSDVELVSRTAMSVLAFEDWSRSARFNARILMGTSSSSAEAMDQRAQPDAVRVYRPRAGESLYKISRRFYGTPHSWRLIAERNGLTDFELTGEELLIIPERGVG